MIKKILFIRLNYCDFKIIVIIVSMFLTSLNISSQINVDTLNRYNDFNQKQGFWVVYLTERLIQTKDSTLASFYAFNYFDNGVAVGFFPSANSYRRKAIKINYKNILPIKGKILLLNGEITYFDKDTISMFEIYKNGIPILREGYFFQKNKKVKYKQILDYNKEYKNEIGSFYYEYYNENEISEKLWYRKKNKSWNLHYDLKKNYEDFDKEMLRYDIETLNRNGKGRTFINSIRKSLNARIDIGYQGNFIFNNYISGFNLDIMSVIRRRYSIGVNYCIANTAFSRNKQFKDFNEIGLAETSTSFHYFFGYNKVNKMSLFANIGTSYAYLRTQDNNDFKDYYNKFLILKPGIWETLNLKGFQINFQIYYRMLLGKSNYQRSIDFNGFGFNIGISIR